MTLFTHFNDEKVNTSKGKGWKYSKKPPSLLSWKGTHENKYLKT